MKKIENKTQQSNRKHTFVASMAMSRTAATAKAMSTTTVTAWPRPRPHPRPQPTHERGRGWGVSKVGQQTQQSDKVYLCGLEKSLATHLVPSGHVYPPVLLLLVAWQISESEQKKKTISFKSCLPSTVKLLWFPQGWTWYWYCQLSMTKILPVPV